MGKLIISTQMTLDGVMTVGEWFNQHGEHDWHWRTSPRTRVPPSYELPSVDLPRAALRPIWRSLGRLKAHTLVELASGSSS